MNKKERDTIKKIIELLDNTLDEKDDSLRRFAIKLCKTNLHYLLVDSEEKYDLHLDLEESFELIEALRFKGITVHDNSEQINNLIKKIGESIDWNN